MPRLLAQCRSFLRKRHVFQQAVDHVVDGHAVGFGAVAEEDAVAERRMNQALRRRRATRATGLQEGAGLRPEHQGLRGSEARAPAHPFVDEVRRAVEFGRLALASRTA